MKYSRFTVSLAASALFYACHGGDVGNPPAKSPRVLKAGGYSGGSVDLPDCKQVGKDATSHECWDKSILANVGRWRNVYSRIVLAEIDLEYQQGKHFPCGMAPRGPVSGEVTAFTAFKPVKWISGDPKGITGVGMVDCWLAADGGKCSSHGGESWYVSPGLNLLFLGENCCIEKHFDAGMRPIYQIYPVEDGLVYDWDGTAFQLDEVLDKITATPEDPAANWVGNVCPPGA
jgi:hypothetical protein